jgi:hypothetical protein
MDMQLIRSLFVKKKAPRTCISGGPRPSQGDLVVELEKTRRCQRPATGKELTKRREQSNGNPTGS